MNGSANSSFTRPEKDITLSQMDYDSRTACSVINYCEDDKNVLSYSECDPLYEIETDGQLFSDDSVNFELQSDGKNVIVYVTSRWGYNDECHS